MVRQSHKATRPDTLVPYWTRVRAGQDLEALSAAAAKKGFKPVALGLKAATSFGNDIRKFASKNVIGVLPGSEAPDEYVLHTAHWDHLGRCTPAPDGDDIRSEEHKSELQSLMRISYAALCLQN